MFFLEIEKYGIDPMSSMFDDLGAEAFRLLLEGATQSDLSIISKMVPRDRPDISTIIEQIVSSRAK